MVFEINHSPFWVPTTHYSHCCYSAGCLALNLVVYICTQQTVSSLKEEILSHSTFCFLTKPSTGSIAWEDFTVSNSILIVFNYLASFGYLIVVFLLSSWFTFYSKHWKSYKTNFRRFMNPHKLHAEFQMGIMRFLRWNGLYFPSDYLRGPRPRKD